MRQAATGSAAIIGILAAAAWLLISGIGLAQSPSQSAASQDTSAGPDGGASQDATSSGCFNVVMPTKDGSPHAPLLLDQCTGASWLLVRDPVVQTQPGGVAQFRYRWFPIAIASTEAVIAEGPVSAPAPAPASKTAAARPPAGSGAANGTASGAAVEARQDPRPPIKEN